MPDPISRHVSKKRSRGFTLLELLIVSLLVSAMMAGIWTLLNSWTRVSERGRVRTERAQLVRSLCDQFRDDVHAVAFRPLSSDSVRSSGSSGSSSSLSTSSTTTDASGADMISDSPTQVVPENSDAALVGGADWLVMDVLQTPNPFLQTPEDQEYVTPEREDDQQAIYAPDLQRVIYSFVASEEEDIESLDGGALEAGVLDDELADIAGAEDDVVVLTEEDGREPAYGLLRMEMARELYGRLAISGTSDTYNSRASSSMRSTVLDIRELVTGARTEDSSLGGIMGSAPSSSLGIEDDMSTLVEMIRRDEVSEVRMVEFRYFDGSSWRSQWNSKTDNGLPVAIELRFELAEQEVLDESAKGGDDSELVENEMGLDDLGTTELPPVEEATLFDDPFSGADTGLEGGLGEGFEEVPYERCLVYLGPKTKR